MFKYAAPDSYAVFTDKKIYYVSNKRISKTNLIEDKMNREMLKEAIAEAKTIKETAIASAKAALEEAFTPQLTAMFAEKLNEMELEEEAEGMEENYSADDQDLSLEEILAELGVTEEEEMMAEGDKSETIDEDLMLEEMSDEDIEELVTQVIDDMIASGKLMAGEENEEDMDMDMDMDNMDDMEDMDVDMDDMEDDVEVDDKEKIEIDELLAEILGEEEELEEAKKAEEKKDELEEAYAAIAELRAELNEVNLLNAKLLYTNKIFKAKNLTESEKVKVLNTFDKAETVKEVKLVFETLTESFKATAKKNPIKESLGSASKTITTAAPKQEQIIEVNDAFARMQRLAGLRK
jgi:hypothetical protein